MLFGDIIYRSMQESFETREHEVSKYTEHFSVRVE
jgi:hypothetical protein